MTRREYVDDKILTKAWTIFRGERKGRLMGPGPGFREAIEGVMPDVLAKIAADDAETVRVQLNGRFVDLSGLALEVYRTMDEAHRKEVGAAFDRGFAGGLNLVSSGGE